MSLIVQNHLILVDMAYQGFASGDIDRDATALRTFVRDGHEVMLCQSFAKNFGLYGQRVGCFSMIGSSKEEATRLESQLKIIARAIYSNPPISGSRVVTTILNDPKLYAQWKVDVKMMADRIIRMRALLKDKLYALGSKHKWEHVTDQIGMFCYSGLTPEQVDRLTNEYHIYLTRNGRISMAGLTTKDIPYLADAIHNVTK
jgi:aspartate aminotransferase, mitochondrial